MPKAVYLERSPAKINLFLKVLEKRADDFHNIETLFQALELSDHLTFEFNFEKANSEDLDFGLEIDSNSEEIKALAEKNIIAKAIEIYFSQLEDSVLDNLAQIEIKIFVDKQIPLEGGLAGGSSNAAATLRALNKFFAENFSWKLSQTQLEQLALELGSDVPFCLRSIEEPRLYAESRGEDFKERKFDFDFDEYKNIILAKPNFGVSTAKAYELLSKQNPRQEKQDGFYNSFEAVVYNEAPSLLAIDEVLKKHGADHVMLSGSGSTMLGFFKDEQKSKEAFEKIKLDGVVFQTSQFLEKTSKYQVIS